MLPSAMPACRAEPDRRRPVRTALLGLGLLGGAVLSAAACGSTAGTATGPATSAVVTTAESIAPTDTGGAKKVFKSDDTDIEVVSGEKFGIRLPEVAGTADAWRVASDPDRSFLEDEGTSFKAEPGAAPGAPGQREFKYRARSAGTTTITFVRGAGTGADRVTFTVTVT